jgi:hypothetical protein
MQSFVVGWAFNWRVASQPVTPAFGDPSGRGPAIARMPAQAMLPFRDRLSSLDNSRTTRGRADLNRDGINSEVGYNARARPMRLMMWSRRFISEACSDKSMSEFKIASIIPRIRPALVIDLWPR